MMRESNLLLALAIHLWLALAFHEFTPKVAIPVVPSNQPFQWRAAWTVRTKRHRHVTVPRP